MQDAERIANQTHRVASGFVLRFVARSVRSPYDCEYIHLVQQLGTRLLTYDEAVLEAFPAVALRPNAFTGGA